MPLLRSGSELGVQNISHVRGSKNSTFVTLRSEGALPKNIAPARRRAHPEGLCVVYPKVLLLHRLSPYSASRMSMRSRRRAVRNRPSARESRRSSGRSLDWMNGRGRSRKKSSACLKLIDGDFLHKFVDGAHGLSRRTVRDN